MSLPQATKTLRQLLRVESLIAEMRLKALIRRASLMMVAMTAGGLGFIMLNVAGYMFLVVSYGPVQAPLFLGGTDLVLSFAALMLALRSGLGPDFALASEVSKTLGEQLADELKSTSILSTPWARPHEMTMANLLIPVATAIFGALRRGSSPKAKPSQVP